MQRWHRRRAWAFCLNPRKDQYIAIDEQSRRKRIATRGAGELHGDGLWVARRLLGKMRCGLRKRNPYEAGGE